MEQYVGIIYFKDGRKEEVAHCSGCGAESSCERQTAMIFEQKTRTAVNSFFQPSRYVVEKRG